MSLTCNVSCGWVDTPSRCSIVVAYRFLRWSPMAFQEQPEAAQNRESTPAGVAEMGECFTPSSRGLTGEAPERQDTCAYPYEGVNPQIIKQKQCICWCPGVCLRTLTATGNVQHASSWGRLTSMSSSTDESPLGRLGSIPGFEQISTTMSRSPVYTPIFPKTHNHANHPPDHAPAAAPTAATLAVVAGRYRGSN